MIAVFVNCFAVLVGAVFGLLFAKKFSDELSDMIQTAAGIVTVVLGIQMAFKYDNIIFLTLSLILGGIIGYIIDIDGAILRFGNFLSRVVSKNQKDVPQQNLENQKNKNFAYAFLNSSVLFCVGAMSIVGSFKAGIEHDYSITFTKSILDGFMAISFAAAMGIGTAFSIITILVYQGALTLLSGVIQPYVSDLLISELTACGGAIIVMIGINLLGLKKIKTANYLPALVFECLFVVLFPIVKNLFIQ